MKKTDELTQAADKYQQIALQIKELEKQAAPLKKKLLDYAKEVDMGICAISDIVIEKRITTKTIVDESLITPDWLYRMQQQGRAGLLSISLTKEAASDADARDLLDEVKFSIKQTITYAIRV